MNADQVMQAIEKIEADYDPEHDMPTDIQVTWVDHLLLEIIVVLIERIDKLELIINHIPINEKWKEF